MSRNKKQVLATISATKEKPLSSSDSDVRFGSRAIEAVTHPDNMSSASESSEPSRFRQVNSARNSHSRSRPQTHHPNSKHESKNSEPKSASDIITNLETNASRHSASAFDDFLSQITAVAELSDIPQPAPSSISKTDQMPSPRRSSVSTLLTTSAPTQSASTISARRTSEPRRSSTDLHSAPKMTHRTLFPRNERRNGNGAKERHRDALLEVVDAEVHVHEKERVHHVSERDEELDSAESDFDDAECERLRRDHVTDMEELERQFMLLKVFYWSFFNILFLYFNFFSWRILNSSVSIFDCFYSTVLSIFSFSKSFWKFCCARYCNCYCFITYLVFKFAFDQSALCLFWPTDSVASRALRATRRAPDRAALSRAVRVLAGRRGPPLEGEGAHRESGGFARPAPAIRSQQVRITGHRHLHVHCPFRSIEWFESSFIFSLFTILVSVQCSHMIYRRSWVRNFRFCLLRTRTLQCYRRAFHLFLSDRYEGELRSFELSQQSEQELLVDALRAEIEERIRALTEEHTAAKGVRYLLGTVYSTLCFDIRNRKYFVGTHTGSDSVHYVPYRFSCFRASHDAA